MPIPSNRRLFHGVTVGKLRRAWWLKDDILRKVFYTPPFPPKSLKEVLDWDVAGRMMYLALAAHRAGWPAKLSLPEDEIGYVGYTLWYVP